MVRTNEALFEKRKGKTSVSKFSSKEQNINVNKILLSKSNLKVIAVIYLSRHLLFSEYNMRVS